MLAGVFDGLHGSGRLLPLTADGAEFDFLHIFTRSPQPFLDLLPVTCLFRDRLRFIISR
jgi:hypothetical protein